MSQILGKAISSAAILVGLFIAAYVLSVLYAQSQVGHMHGRGPSVSEYAEGFHGVALRATGVGFFALVSIAVVWMVRFANSKNDINYLKRFEKSINASIFLYPLLFALVFVLFMVCYIVLFRLNLV